MKLLIRNLATTTTEAELRVLFEAHGPVQSCSLVMDKKTGSSKGFGFIEMPKPGDAKTAMKTLNGKEVAGNKIRVKKAEAKIPTTKEPVLKEEPSTVVSSEQKPKARKQDPLHGITLEMVLNSLVEKYGWDELARRIKINCFTHDPSIKSSLNFLRKTAWARQKVEALYLENK